MPTVNGIVVHQTDTTNVSQQFNTLANGKAGAHFVIDKKGTIFQTARVNHKVDHTGKIKSRCYETKTCSAEELEKIKALYFQNGVKFAKRAENLSDYEKTKPYPERYLSNEDSIGIEIVGKYDAQRKQFEVIISDQNASLKWSVHTLGIELLLFDEDVSTHPKISRKKPSEASTANWE